MRTAYPTELIGSLSMIDSLLPLCACQGIGGTMCTGLTCASLHKDHLLEPKELLVLQRYFGLEEYRLSL